MDPKERATAEALLRHSFLSHAPSTAPAAFDAYLPPRPVDMNAIPTPKRRIIRSLVEKAVATRLANLAKVAHGHAMDEDSVGSTSGCTLVPHFRDR